MQISDAQASKILGVKQKYSTSGRKEYPCPAFWASPIDWENKKGPNSLHGKVSDAAVSAEYIDFPDSPSAQAQYQTLRAAALKGRVDKFGHTWREVDPVGSTGNAEAYLDIPVPKMLTTAYGSQFVSSLVGRCGSRLLRVNASKDTFYSAVMDGHSPTEQNIVQRSRLPVSVAKELRAAYKLLGAPLCAGDTLPSIAVGPYQLQGN